jgi:hypothetical protein
VQLDVDGFPLVVAFVLRALTSARRQQNFYLERLPRTAICQGLSRIASDLIVSAFDTPFQVLVLLPTFFSIPSSPPHMLPIILDVRGAVWWGGCCTEVAGMSDSRPRSMPRGGWP